MAKSYYGPGSTGTSVPVQASQWTGGYTQQQLAAGMGPQSNSLGRSYGGYDPTTNRFTPFFTDVNARQAAPQAGGGDAALEAARKQAFDSLGQGSSIFRGPLGQATQGNLLGRVSGQDQPYDQATQDRMFAQAADQSASAAQAQDARARDFFAASGTAGSGAQLGGLLDTATAHDQRMQAARSDIANRAQLENFGARERAADASGQYMGQQAAGEAPYRLKESDLLSRMEVTGQDPMAASLLAALGMLGGGTRARGGVQGPVDNGFRSTGQTVSSTRPNMSTTSRTSNARGAPSPAASSAPASGFFGQQQNPFGAFAGQLGQLSGAPQQGASGAGYGPAMIPGAAFGGYQAGQAMGPTANGVGMTGAAGFNPYSRGIESQYGAGMGGMFSPATSSGVDVYGLGRGIENQSAMGGMFTPAAPAQPVYPWSTQVAPAQPGAPQLAGAMGSLPAPMDYPWPTQVRGSNLYGGY